MISANNWKAESLQIAISNYCKGYYNYASAVGFESASDFLSDSLSMKNLRPKT
jgi:hypothetical protein